MTGFCSAGKRVLNYCRNAEALIGALARKAATLRLLAAALDT